MSFPPIVSEVNQIPLEDAVFAAQFFIDYYTEVNGDIQAYMRRNKLAKMESKENTLFGFGPEDDLFDDFTMSPEDMTFDIEEVSSSKFMSYLDIVSSHNNEAAIPGKVMMLLVREMNTKKIVGMIRLGSPTINSKPRNQWLGQPLDSSNLDMMKRFNESTIMGFVIVPAQPFGYNYLGGKLLASICCSHEIRERMSKKYDINVCAFETTSLYGSTKSASQYDGMKPFLRYIGLTDSSNVPPVDPSQYQFIHDWFRTQIGGLLVPETATSKKSKQMQRMIRILNASLGDHPIRSDLADALSDARDTTEQKRTYISTYGYSNVADYLALRTDTLVKAENYDRFSMTNAIDWWRKKASKRYIQLQKDDRLRSTLETWNRNADDIDIIR